MKATCTWKEKMSFTGSSDGHEVAMDTKPPLGSDSAMSPKQLLLNALCGCTAMDVVALMKKYKQPIDSFEIEANGTVKENGHPAVFGEIRLTFKLKGSIDSEKAIEAVNLSQTKYCSLSAMLSKAVPISYAIEVNGATVATGETRFTT